MKKLTTESFIKKCRETIGDTYDYSLVDYQGAKQNILIICKEHGVFSQIAGNHLHLKICPKCSVENGYLKRTMTTAEFINRANIVHNNKFNYSKTEYKHFSIPLIVSCPEHGDFETLANNHLCNNDCLKCTRERRALSLRKSPEDFLKQAAKIHGDLFDYSLAEYTTKKQKITIICKIHGEFKQAPYAHLRGHGCPECSKNFNTFKKTDWIEKSKGRIGIFYIIRCFNEKESFYKLGITYKSVKFRYRKSMMPYSYEIIKEITSKNLSYIWDLELLNKKLILNHRYKPEIYFEGCIYECFKDLNMIKLDDINNLPQIKAKAA